MGVYKGTLELAEAFKDMKIDGAGNLLPFTRQLARALFTAEEMLKEAEEVCRLHLHGAHEQICELENCHCQAQITFKWLAKRKEMTE